MYWFANGFHLSHKLTFFWLSFLFGNIGRTLIDVYDSLSKTIIDREVADINSIIKRGVERKRNQNNKQL